jgi:D-arabinose 1-dehydrogenase-like Zn-dependent alcohol dehydrogenase
MAMAAKSMGAFPSIVEINPEKLSRSRAFREYLDIRTASSVTNQLFDVAINACPSSETLWAGVSRLKAGGRFCLFSGFTGDGVFPVTYLNEIHYKQLRLVGAYGCKRDQMTKAILILNEFQEAARLLIEEEIHLEEIPSRLKSVLDGQTLKIIVNIQPE